MGSADMVFRWRMSSRSGGNGQCVELGRAEPAWRKSSHSGGNGECIELAGCGAIRDSKNPNGPRIHVNLDALLDAIRTGRLDS